MTGIDKKVAVTILDRKNHILYTCGECRWYDEENKRCLRCFPNTKLRSEQGACVYFLMFKPKRKMFINVPRE